VRDAYFDWTKRICGLMTREALSKTAEFLKNSVGQMNIEAIATSGAQRVTTSRLGDRRGGGREAIRWFRREFPVDR